LSKASFSILHKILFVFW